MEHLERHRTMRAAVSGPIFRGVAASGGHADAGDRAWIRRRRSSATASRVSARRQTFSVHGAPLVRGRRNSTISVGGLDDGSRVAIGSMDSTPVYVEPGWLLTSRQECLRRRPSISNRSRSRGIQSNCLTNRRGCWIRRSPIRPARRRRSATGISCVLLGDRRRTRSRRWYDADRQAHRRSASASGPLRGL